MINTEPSPALFYIVEMAIGRNSGPTPNPVPISEMCHFVLDAVLALGALDNAGSNIVLIKRTRKKGSVMIRREQSPDPVWARPSPGWIVTFGCTL